jgi:hypothetical protein
LVDPPFVSLPPPGEALSQVEVLAKDQLSEFVPVLINEKVSFVTVNGPPTPPQEVKPVAGVMSKGSGGQ